jgi:uncharacterized membrane protein
VVELSAHPHLKSALDIVNKDGKSRPLQGRLSRADSSVWIIGAALFAFVAKILIALNTFGSNDVVAFYMFARSLHEHGLEWTYRHGVALSGNSPVFNHPPLTAYYLELIGALSRNEFFRVSGLTFPFLLRLPGIVADLVVVFVLLRISATTAQLRLPTWALILFALSPVSLMVSGFHGNTDPVMVMFLAIAAYMCVRERPLLCAIFFALSCQVKVIPLLFFPLLFFFWLNQKSALRFLLPFALVMVAIWSQPLLGVPGLFLRNVLFYGSYWGEWGVTYWLWLTRYSQFDVIGFANLPPAATVVATLLKAGIVSAVVVIAWRRRNLSGAAVVSSIAYAWFVFFALSPGFCVYYLIWLAPFVLLLSPSLYAWLTAASSVSLFVFYNTLAGGLPWRIAVSKFSDPARFNLIAPWALWAWAVVICGLVICWTKAARANPSLRLLSLKTSSAEAS